MTGTENVEHRERFKYIQYTEDEIMTENQNSRFVARHNKIDDQDGGSKI